MRSLLDASTSVEENFFVRHLDVHPEILVGEKIFGEHVGEMMCVDDDFADAEGAQPYEREFEECVAGNFDERLGTIVGERAKASAKAGGQYHGLHLAIFSGK